MEVPSETESEPEPELSFSDTESSRYSFHSSDEDEVNEKTENVAAADDPIHDNNSRDSSPHHSDDKSKPDQGQQSPSESESDSDTPCSVSSDRKEVRGKKRKRKTGSNRKEKRFTCRFSACSKQFASKPSLDKHVIRTHTNERPFPCPEVDCEYRGKIKADLQSHRLAVHFNDIPGITIYTCSYPGCGKQSGFKKYIEQHERDCHSDEKPFPCPHSGCNFRTKRMGNLNDHLKSSKHSPDHQPLRKNSSISCRFPGCSARLGSKHTLGLHFVRAHTNERPFPCPESDCEFRGKTKCDISTHIRRSHSDERPFSCPDTICVYSTKTRGDLNKHIKAGRHISSMILCDEPGCGFKSVLMKLMQVHQEKMHGNKIQ
jgi:hypothetical protein